MSYSDKISRILRSSSEDKSENGSLDSEALLQEDDFRAQQLKKKSFRKKYSSLLIQTVLLSVYTVIVILAVRSVSGPESPYDTWIVSPANKAIEYTRLTFQNSLEGGNVFRGEPRDELHYAWQGLLKYMNIRVQDEDLRKINRTSVPLNDEKGGYLVTLDVFHELHCLNQLREQVYREYYPDKHSKAKQLEHVDHCLDLLRQVVMCHGDVSLQTFGWRDDYRWPWPNFEVQHTCRKWEKIQEWSKENSIPSLIGPIIAHPVLGVSWRADEES